MMMMLDLASKKFEADVARLLEMVESRALFHSKKLAPTPLNPLAHERSANVRFMPLPVPGCLCSTSSGFDIFVQTHVKDSKGFSEKFVSGNDNQLPVRHRFTIAHEIAHTYFYDLSKQPPSMQFPPNADKELRRMEKACDAIANRMLLPKLILEDFVKKNDPTDPNRLRELAGKSAVSPQVVVSAFGSSTGCLPHNSGIASVAHDGTCYRITSFAFGALLKTRFTLAKGQKLSEWIGSQDFMPNGGTQSQVTFRRTAKTDKRTIYSFVANFEPVTIPSPRVNYFVSISQSEINQPDLLGQS